ncbi:MAG TPA: biliverdin-producing heme oxygenase [Ramlibacter sp.]
MREATASRHAAIDTLLALRQPFGAAHYTCVLQGFATFLTAWEPRMAQVLPPQWQSWFAASTRLHLVQQDLAALGLPPAPPLVASATPNTPAAALGSLYVLEGSALGGQFIAAAARRQLGLTPDHGTAYFHGCGSATAARWREFLAPLDADLASPAASAQAVQGANATFDVLTDLFRGLLEHRELAAA